MRSNGLGCGGQGPVNECFGINTIANHIALMDKLKTYRERIICVGKNNRKWLSKTDNFELQIQ